MNELIATAKKEKNTQLRQTLQKELKAYLKQIETIKKAEVRALLKERFPYPIFLYNADKVGITATGEEDQNELYPNSNQPSDCNVTCLELYHQFLSNPERFILNLEGSAE